MKSKVSKILFVLIISALSGAYLFLSVKNINGQSVNVTACVGDCPVIISYFCGDGNINPGEQCDGLNLAGQTCVTRGFIGGNLSCYSNCALNTSSCISAPPPSGGGGGGGGSVGGSYTSVASTQVYFEGLAYPSSEVTLLKNAEVVAVTQAGPDAKFTISVANLPVGTYTFGVWSSDANGNRSVTQTFTVSLTSGAGTVISGIFLSPTITADKTEVRQGDILTMFGSTVPKSDVNIVVNSDNQIVSSTISKEDGTWIYKVDTTQLELGDHSASARSFTTTDISPISDSVFFKVGDKNVLTLTKNIYKKVDLNKDGKVNLIDFSIMAYWYKKPLTVQSKAIVDLNGDGVVDLKDFSILAYYWTG